MSKQLEDEIEYYYDSHPTEEDMMGETAFHADLVSYLVAVLRWLYREQACAVHENLNFYMTRDVMENPLVPDVAVVKGVPYAKRRSWRVGRTGPPPQVVFEILSQETWEKDCALLALTLMRFERLSALDTSRICLR